VVLEECPFYGESGGQVGDKGILYLKDEAGKEAGKIEVLDTKKENELIVLICKFQADAEAKLRSAATVSAKVNAKLRQGTAANHSATHLLHSALKEVLGTHVAQKGSLVAPDQLRFDFAHFSKVTQEEMAVIENRVNEKIRENIALQEMRNVPIEEAKALGATALFGDKYGDFVRVIIFDPAWSMELCGGTHVGATGQIGMFKLVAESSVAAGVRRIEALTGDAARQYIEEKMAIAEEISGLLNHPKDLVKAVSQLIAEKDVLQKKLEAAELSRKNQLKAELLKSVSKSGEINRVIARVEVGQADTLRQLCFEIREQVENLFMVLAAEVEGKPQIAVMISDNLVAEKGMNASNIARELGKEIKGGGGGQPFFATAGGQDLTGLERVVTNALVLT
jgi:alanyl-tRNA synthetase